MTLLDTRQGLSGLDYFRKMLAGELPPPAMLDLFNIRLVEVEAGRVVFAAMAEERFYNGTGVAHGGFAATLLDTALVIPGTNIRFGLDALIGLVPGIGDAVTTAMSLYIDHEAHQLGAPRHVIARMLANVALDGVVGAVPLVGDAFDVIGVLVRYDDCFD